MEKLFIENKYIYYNKIAASPEEILEILHADDSLLQYDCVVFASDIASGDLQFENLVNYYNTQFFAIVVNEPAIFNSELNELREYEYLLRISSKKIYGINCAHDENIVNINDYSYASQTLAYIIAKYYLRLTKLNLLDSIFSNICSLMQANDNLNAFTNKLSEYLENSEEYSKINGSTLPYYVIEADDTCYGVIKDFTNSIKRALQESGEDITDDLSLLEFKGIIGFQSPAINSEFFKKMKCPKYVFWTDNPLMFPEFFESTDDNYHYLCIDSNYANNLKKYFKTKNSYFVPLAGRKNPNYNNLYRPYDITFIGSYREPDYTVINTTAKEQFWNYILEHPLLTFEDALENLDYTNVPDTLISFKEVCQCVINHFRKNIIEEIISNGLSIHVFGDSWKNFDTKYKENLIIHNTLSVDESMDIMSQSKISLNIMTWHKNGFTERIANSMLSGAVCVTEESQYIKSVFDNGKNIVLYRLDMLGLLPNTIKKLLSNAEQLKTIASSGYNKCVENFTWNNLIEAIKKEM